MKTKTKTRTLNARKASKTRSARPRPAETRTARAGTKSARPARSVRPAAKNEYRPEDVIKTNGSLELDPRLLQLTSARAIAQSIKRSADRSEDLHNTPFHSAMSMLNVLLSHIEVHKARLEAAKKELRQLYGEADEAPSFEPPTPPMEYARQRNGMKRSEKPRNGKRGTQRAG